MATGVKPLRFEPPKLATTGIGRISRVSAEVSALAEAREQGRRAALAEVEAEVSAAVQQHRLAQERMERAAQVLAAAIDQIEHIDLGTLHDFEQQVLALAVSIAEEIVGNEVSTTHEVAITSARRALAMTPERGDVALRVHPGDLGAVLESLGNMGHRAGDVQVVADDGVSPGGCIATTGPLRVDAQLDGVFDRIRDAFRS